METHQRYFSVLGDSLSTLAGANPPECAVFYRGGIGFEAGVLSPADTWWGQVICAFGGTLLVNNAWSGSLVCRHPQCEIPSYGCSDERTAGLGDAQKSPDTVLILMGINDWGAGMRLHPACDRAGNADLSDEACFANAYRIMLAKIRRFHPQSRIFCIAPGRSRCTRKPSFTFPAQMHGQTLAAFNRVIADCAGAAGCGLIDLSAALPEPFDTVDGFHPNAAGMHSIAQAVIAGIRGQTAR